ncbi:MAG: DUF1648 domain-containing protein [Actinomycetales bacterium]|nr:DUF1648 domain-containing protein [Actinomycetales bacterium]
MEDRRRIVVRAVWVALVVPVLVTVVAVALQLAWLGQLPDPVAVHWGTSGAPNGFAAAWVVPVMTAATGLLLPGIMAAVTIPALGRGAQGATFRFLAATAAGMATMTAVISTWSVAVQRGLGDAASAPSIVPAMLVGLVAALAVGVLGWFAQPVQHHVVPGAVAAAPMPVRAGERVMWTRTATAARWLSGLLLAVTALNAALAVLFWFTSPEAAPIVAATALLVLLAFASTASFTVRVDREGLTVTSALGVPRFRVPLDDVVSAGTGDTVGFGEFGGYGIRTAGHGTGVILRNGEALRVTRTSGRQFVVTVDDAALGASVLQGLVAQHRAGAA